MTGRMIGAPLRRTVTFILTAMGIGSFVVAAVLVLVGTSEDIGTTAVTVLHGAGLVLVVGGLAAAIAWRSRASGLPVEPQRHLVATIVAAAIAEAGFLISAIAYWFSQNLLLIAGSSLGWLAVLLVLLGVNRAVEFGGG